MKIKTIDITAKEWRDKVNGNSYFSARVTLNYGMKTEKTVAVPFQYGYGDHYGMKSMMELVNAGVIGKPVGKDFALVPWRYCRENGIVLRTNKIENCKKNEVIEFGTL